MCRVKLPLCTLCSVLSDIFFNLQSLKCYLLLTFCVTFTKLQTVQHPDKSLTLHFVRAKGKSQSISPTCWDSIREVFPLWGSRWSRQIREEVRNVLNQPERKKIEGRTDLSFHGYWLFSGVKVPLFYFFMKCLRENKINMGKIYSLGMNDAPTFDEPSSSFIFWSNFLILVFFDRFLTWFWQSPNLVTLGAFLFLFIAGQIWTWVPNNWPIFFWNNEVKTLLKLIFYVQSTCVYIVLYNSKTLAWILYTNIN